MTHPVKIAVVLLCVGAAFALYRAAVPEKKISAPLLKTAPSPKPSVSTEPVLRAVLGNTVIDPDAGKWSLRQQAPAQATITEVMANSLPSHNKHAVHLQVTAVDPDKFWAAQILKVVPQEIQTGKKMLVRFWGRSKHNTPIWVIFEEGKPPHTPEFQEKFTLTPEWREYTKPFTTKRDHIDPHANFCIKAGIQVGEVEVAGIRVEEY